MASLSMLLALASAGLLIANIYPQANSASIIYNGIFPAISMIAFIGMFFYISALKKEQEEESYKSEVERLKLELARTRKRVAEGITEIEFPEEMKRKAV
ncbi:MAG: hypothetical protein ACLFSQ_02945 [Candidatus Zixiibacteriota bacterium]